MFTLVKECSCPHATLLASRCDPFLYVLGSNWFSLCAVLLSYEQQPSDLHITYFSHCFSFRVEGGELFDRVVSQGKLDEATAKLYFYQMITACKVPKKN